MRAAFCLILAGLLLASSPGHADELPRAEPEEVGLSTEKLAAIGQEVDQRIESKAIAGAVTVVARRGKVVLLEARGSFQEDSIFRIFSMTKPVAVAAALILVDEGKLALDDPVSKHLPEFEDLTVHGSAESPPPMTVRHLMTHTSGLTYGLFGTSEVDTQYRRAGLLNRNGTLEEMAAKLAKIPLLHAPGEKWVYSVSIDLLGRIVEVVSKQPFDVFHYCIDVQRHWTGCGISAKFQESL